ncbi:MAG: PP2C family protein-serine/threonine phosphatase [Thermoanaerobaculia bacterium]|nr:PP2C family protein-serine/threonine phosphatase [Thermoanaerobaculia bacterium]
MDYKSLLSQVQKTISELSVPGEGVRAVAAMAETIAQNFREQLDISGGRLYAYREDDYELIHRFGRKRKDELGISVSEKYRPIRLLLESGVIVMDRSDPEVDARLEKQLGAARFAAISVGDDDYILSFDVSPDSSRDDILFSLNIIRTVINQRLRVDRYASILEEAKHIQQSILPSRAPKFEGFDLFGRTVPAEQVSGDYYDFIPISRDSLGIAVADATGHGLPAALMVRDVHMGLRMGTDRDFKIVRTVQKLNEIIHRSRLTTKFVSLFYGELETSGTFIYTNAGHTPAIHFHRNSTDELRHGGAVLGPTPDATYTRGYVQIESGDILCLYSDGIVEAANAEGEEFGVDRLKRLVRRHRNESAESICSVVLDRAARFGVTEPDDRTIVIVKRESENGG